MNTTQQDSAMSVLYEVIIFFDFSFFFVYHRKSHKTPITESNVSLRYIKLYGYVHV